MARKSSKSLNKSTKPFVINFEVVLIIILIIVAILLVCFLNRKFRGVEGFQTTTAKETTKELHFFYADWCGYSTKYIKNYLHDLKTKLGANSGKLKEYNVDNDDVKEKATAAGVTKLPTFYTFTNGKYDDDQH